MSVAPKPPAARSSQAPDALIGTRVAGRYLIERVHGRGGMSVVYAAYDEELSNEVALKVMDEHSAQDPVAVERFVLETQMQSALNHDNVVNVSDFGHLGDGRPFLVMPMVIGIDLATLLALRGPQHPRKVAALLKGVSSALDAIHDKGIVHRDIKSENLMYVEWDDGREEVMLLDFGIAAARLVTTPLHDTASGTPEFMPPEALAGEACDHRGDIYSLATVAFELITGHLPFDSADLVELERRKITEVARLLSQATPIKFPDGVEAVIARGLARNPDKRQSSAGQLVAELETAAAPMPEQTPLPAARVKRASAYPTLVGTGDRVRAATAAAALLRKMRNTRPGASSSKPGTLIGVGPSSATSSALTSVAPAAPASNPGSSGNGASARSSTAPAAAASKGGSTGAASKGSGTGAPKSGNPTIGTKAADVMAAKVSASLKANGGGSSARKSTAPAGSGAGAGSSQSTAPQRPSAADPKTTASGMTSRPSRSVAPPVVAPPARAQEGKSEISTVRSLPTLRERIIPPNPASISTPPALGTSAQDSTGAEPPTTLGLTPLSVLAPQVQAPAPSGADEPPDLAESDPSQALAYEDFPAASKRRSIPVPDPASLQPPPDRDTEDATELRAARSSAGRAWLYASLVGAAVFGIWLLAHPQLAVPPAATATEPVAPMEPVAATATPPSVASAAVIAPTPPAEPAAAEPATAPTAADPALAAAEPTRIADPTPNPPSAASPRVDRGEAKHLAHDDVTERKRAEPAPAIQASQVLTIKPAEPKRVAARDKPNKAHAALEAPEAPDRPEAQADPEVARALAQEGTNAMLRGDFDSAATKFSQALAADPSHAPAWRGKALILERKGKTAEAAKAFRQFLKLAPNGAAADTVRARLQALESK